MDLFERKPDKNIKELIAELSYVDLSVLGPYIAKFISVTTGEDYVFQPNAVMYSTRSCIVDGVRLKKPVAVHYILLIKSSAMKDEYLRGLDKDLSDIEASGNGIILFKSNEQEEIDYEKMTFTYPRDLNGHEVSSDTRKFPFYYLDDNKELHQSYENLGFMYSIIDNLIQDRIYMEMIEVERALRFAVEGNEKFKEYIKRAK